jgi:hypothetical protein
MHTSTGSGLGELLASVIDKRCLRGQAHGWRAEHGERHEKRLQPAVAAPGFDPLK